MDGNSTELQYQQTNKLKTSTGAQDGIVAQTALVVPERTQSHGPAEKLVSNLQLVRGVCGLLTGGPGLAVILSPVIAGTQLLLLAAHQRPCTQSMPLGRSSWLQPLLAATDAHTHHDAEQRDEARLSQPGRRVWSCRQADSLMAVSWIIWLVLVELSIQRSG